MYNKMHIVRGNRPPCPRGSHRLAARLPSLARNATSLAVGVGRSVATQIGLTRRVPPRELLVGVPRPRLGVPSSTPPSTGVQPGGRRSESARPTRRMDRLFRHRRSSLRLPAKIFTQPTCMCPLCDGDYVVKASLGSGGFGSVFRVTRREDQRDFVLKKIPVADLNDASDAHTEARELRFLQHPRIVGYEDDFLHTTPQSAVRDAHVHVCIIMELCERDLRQQLEDKRGAGAMFSEEQLLKYLAQICSALSYCHGNSSGPSRSEPSTSGAALPKTLRLRHACPPTAAANPARTAP